MLLLINPLLVVHVIREGQDNVQDLEFKDGKTDELG